MNLLPACPDCGGALSAYKTLDTSEVEWSCTACGSAFDRGQRGGLRPRFVELYFPECPDCQVDMLAVPGKDLVAQWRCPACGFELRI